MIHPFHPGTLTSLVIEFDLALKPLTYINIEIVVAFLVVNFLGLWS